ncbi:MAG: methyl-accepting chemotaxis protein [Proteobacteria bacterium]|nr:methyl-accepting chemotaxis protein [Pseudomonadota bacterium]
MPMKWKLTLSVTVVLLVVGIIFGYLFIEISRNTDERLVSTSESRAMANAKAMQREIALEVVAKTGNELTSKLKHLSKAHKDVHAIVVLDINKSVLATIGNDLDVEKIIHGLNLKAKNKITKNELVIATSPIYSDADLTLNDKRHAGYLIYVESLAEYYKFKKSLEVTIVLFALAALVIAMIVTYFIGSSTAKPLLNLVKTAQRIADGDLKNVEVEAKGSLESTLLASAIKSMAGALQNQIIAIKSLTNDISSSAKDVAGTMTNLASSASEQAAAVTETAATVEQLDQAGKNVAGNANQIVEAAEKTTEASIRGREAVNTTNEIILRIKDDSQDISDKSRRLVSAVEEVGNIIRSVNGIAEQSKILAVNASIEAAKAGEYGSGFAVVAQEVKDLAQQSKDATKEITGTLTSIRQAIESMVETAQQGKDRTEKGVRMITNAGAIMNDLSEAIRENSDFANMIASNIKQQTVGLTQIATSIEQINTTALENQNISRKVSLATSQMTESFDLLTEMVGNWQTKEL